MKLFKPSYSCGAKQSSFSKYEHQEHMIQSNYADHAWDNKPCYGGQAHDYVLGQSMGRLDAKESNHARVNNSINVQAQSMLPSPSIDVQQGHHMNEGMNKYESSMGHQWANNSPRFSNPALANDSRLGVHNEKHMMREMECGWDSKPNQYSNPIQTHNFGEFEYKRHEQKVYNYGEGGFEGGYANKNTIFSCPKYLIQIKTNQPSLIEHKEDHAWPNSTSNFSSPSHDQCNSTSNLFSPTHGQRNSTANFSSPTHGQHNSTSNFSSQSHGQRSSLAMNKEEHLMEKMDHGWANSTSKFSSPTHAQHLGLEMQKDDNLKGKMDHGWPNSPTRFSSSTPTHQSAQAMYNNDHMMQKRDHGWAHSPNRFSDSTQTHHTSLEKMGHGWDNSPNKLLSPTQANYSNCKLHKKDHLTGNMDHGWANSPTKYSGPNNFNSSNHIEHAQLGRGLKSSNGFGSIQANHPAHTSYDVYDQHVDDDVHDIMDEILSKYPAHNIGSGPGSSWAAKPSSYAGQNQVGGFAKQQAFGGLAQYGGAIQSMNRSTAKFALNTEMNAGYSSNFGKEQYSASSNSKFEAQSLINRGAY